MARFAAKWSTEYVEYVFDGVHYGSLAGPTLTIRARGPVPLAADRAAAAPAGPGKLERERAYLIQMPQQHQTPPPPSYQAGGGRDDAGEGDGVPLMPLMPLGGGGGR